MIADISGYTKWTVEETSDGYDSEFFSKHFNVEIKDFKNYHITRDTNSRSDLWLIGACVLPGHLFLSFHTGRVDWASNGIVENAQAYQEIKKQINGM